MTFLAGLILSASLFIIFNALASSPKKKKSGTSPKSGAEPKKEQ